MKKLIRLFVVALFPVAALAGTAQGKVTLADAHAVHSAKTPARFTLTVTAPGASGGGSFTGVTTDGFPLKWEDLTHVAYVAHANPANVKNGHVSTGDEFVMIVGNNGSAYVAGKVSWLDGLKTHREQGRMVQVPVVRDFCGTESLSLSPGQSAGFFLGGDRVEVTRNS